MEGTACEYLLLVPREQGNQYPIVNISSKYPAYVVNV